MGWAKTKIPGSKLSASLTFKHAVWHYIGRQDAGYWTSFSCNLLGMPLEIYFGNDWENPGEYAFWVSTSFPFPITFKKETISNPDPGELDWVEFTITVESSGETATELHVDPEPFTDKAVTHAKENILRERWVEADGGVDVTVNGEKTHVNLNAVGATINLYGVVDAHDWTFQPETGDMKYVFSIENIEICGTKINTDGLTPRTWGKKWEDEDNALWVEGFGGDSIGFWRKGVYSTPPYFFYDFNYVINAPFAYDFSGIELKWMDGEDVEDDVIVFCSGLRRLNSNGIDLGDWRGTLKELREKGLVVQKHGCYSWDDWAPDMQSEVSLYLGMKEAEKKGIEIRGPKPELKLEGAGYGVVVSGGDVKDSPFDGLYYLGGVMDGENFYTNGYGYIYNIGEDAWGVGPDLTVPPFYISEDGGPQGIYMVNTDSYNDDIIDEGTGQRRFSGFSGYGIGPVVSKEEKETLFANIQCKHPSFKHDATFIIDGWPLSSQDRTSSPYVHDVAKLVYDNPKGIYGEAHTHSSWYSPDSSAQITSGGNVAVSGSVGKLKLDLKCNYVERQQKVGQEDEIPVPLAYMSRRHDSCLGMGATPETHEAVWDWRGRYLMLSFNIDSLPQKVGVEIEYYNDLDNISDNHKTDSTRQTEYSYSTGELRTIEREITVKDKDIETGISSFLIDLVDEHPVAMAKSITLTLPQTATKLYEPVLTHDVGDKQEVTPISPFYRVAPDSTGFAFKNCETWTYNQGLVSVVFNGLHKQALFMPDNAKGGPVEKCMDTLNVLIGAKTGIDLTTNYTISSWPVTISGDSFSLVYSQAAENSHMKDDAGTVLKAFNCYDIAPCLEEFGDENEFQIPIAVRCSRMFCVAGIEYKFYSKKYVGGRCHGIGLKSDEPKDYPRARRGRISSLYKRLLGSDDKWERVDAPALLPDNHGYWVSKGVPIFDPNDEKRQLLEFAIINDEEYDSMGRFATREFANKNALIILGDGDTNCIGLKDNIVFIPYSRGKSLFLLYTSPADGHWNDDESKAPYKVPKLIKKGTDGSISVMTNRNADIFVFHVSDGKVCRFVTHNLGGDFSEESELDMEDIGEISKFFCFENNGIQFGLSINNDGELYSILSKDHFDNYDKYLISSGINPECQPSGYFSHGVVFCYVVGDEGVDCYKSEDVGKSWVITGEEEGGEE